MLQFLLGIVWSIDNLAGFLVIGLCLPIKKLFPAKRPDRMIVSQPKLYLKFVSDKF